MRNGELAMKVILAGDFEHLGSNILRELVRRGYEVVGGRMAREAEGADASTHRTVRVDVYPSCHSNTLGFHLIHSSRCSSAGVKNLAASPQA